MCRIIKTLCFLILFGILFLPISDKQEIKIDEEVEDYPLVLEVPKFQKQFLVDPSIEGLEENHVCSLQPIMHFHQTILLFGHNNRYVFHFIYDLQIGDQIILRKGQKQVSYTVTEHKIISVENKDYLEKKDSPELRLFTCTLNNQMRYVVIAK